MRAVLANHAEDRMKGVVFRPSASEPTPDGPVRSEPQHGVKPYLEGTRTEKWPFRAFAGHSGAQAEKTPAQIAVGGETDRDGFGIHMRRLIVVPGLPDLGGELRLPPGSQTLPCGETCPKRRGESPPPPHQ